MSFDSADENAYEAITESAGDTRWAFGTGFTDPLAGVDTTAAPGVDAADLAAYCLMLGDDALVLSQRLQQWVTRLPELEDEVAVANIALDLLGQARLLLARAGRAEGAGRGEDELAFRRDPAQFRSVLLAELADLDFAQLVVRLLVFSTWRLAVFARLVDSADPVLSAIADKGVKELTYHRDYAARWVVRLGDGTPLSARRCQAAVAAVWPYLPELFVGHEVELRLAAVGAAVDPSLVRDEVDGVLAHVLAEATLDPPAVTAAVATGGRDGTHTEAMEPLLAELQGVARALPGGTW